MITVLECRYDEVEKFREHEGKVPASGLAWWQGKRKLGEGVDRKRQEPDGHLKTPPDYALPEW